MISRAQVARYVAQRLPRDRHEAIRLAAAWMVDQGRVGEVRYLANDIARALADEGYLYARITTATQLGESARSEIEKFVARETGATRVEANTDINPDLIGGVRIETPDLELDASVAHKFAKFVEGVSV